MYKGLLYISVIISFAWTLKLDLHKFLQDILMHVDLQVNSSQLMGGNTLVRFYNVSDLSIFDFWRMSREK